MHLIPIINKKYIQRHYLYIMYAPKIILTGDGKGNMTDAVKIGITDTPWERLRCYHKAGISYIFNFLFEGERNDIKKLEKEVLAYFRDQLLKHSFADVFSKEIIASEVDDVHEVVATFIDHYGYNVNLRAIGYDSTTTSTCPFGHKPQKKEESLKKSLESSTFDQIFKF